MFTGIITDIGAVLSNVPSDAGRRLAIRCAYDPDSIDIGASICCAGACMTVVDKGHGDAGEGWFAVDVSPESLGRTTIGDWREATRINLERSLAIGAELGGHIVTGHIDGIARIVERAEEGDAVRFTIEAPAQLARFIATKGSVALDGTSLTVNTVVENRFTVMLIPHSLTVTTWGERAAGDNLNLEVDLMARYAARLMDHQPPDED